MSSMLVISIVNYNSREHLERCLDSIYAHPPAVEFATYVVDNNSSDGSVPLLQERFPQVHLLANRKNVGFGRANNQVFRLTCPKYYLVLNPDVVVTPGSLEAMMAFLEDHPDVGAVGCKVLNSDRSLQFSCRRYPTVPVTLFRGLRLDILFPRARMISRYLMADWDHSQVARVDWLLGSCLMLRKSALDDVGVFDEGYFLYFEDVDLCYRIAKNWQICYYPRVHIIHHHQQQSRCSGSLSCRLHHLKSACRFFRKCGLRRSRPPLEGNHSWRSKKRLSS